MPLTRRRNAAVALGSSKNQEKKEPSQAGEQKTSARRLTSASTQKSGATATSDALKHLRISQEGGDESKVKLPRIVRRTTEGNDRVELKFYDKPSQVVTLDASEIGGLTNLAEPILAGLISYLDTISPRTRYVALHSLRLGFVKFISATSPHASLDDLDEVVLNAYAQWQNSPAAGFRNRRLKPGTAGYRVGVLRSVLTKLAKGTKWSSQAIRALGELPRNLPRTENNGQVEIISMEHLERIRAAAHKDLLEIQARIERGKEVLLSGQAEIAKGSRDYRREDVALAAMVELFPGAFPTSDQATKAPKELVSAVYKASRGKQRIKALAGFRQAAPGDLVPLVILLTIEGGFNPETVVALKTSDITQYNLFGIKLTRINGPKHRAKSKVSRRDLDTHVVEPWLATLAELTQRLRGVAESGHEDMLFLYKATSGCVEKARSFEANGIWHHSLAMFRKRHQLEHFTLRHIRATLLDEIGQRHGSIAVQHAANHTSFGVTEGHYVGPGTRQRDRERLAEAVRLTERFINTNGAIDVRRSARPAHHDKGAATPGFACRDPYDSPLEGQRKNLLCKAYGQCPMCPMVVIPTGDPVSVAYWQALLEAVDATRLDLDPQQWLGKWGLVAADIVSLLDTVPVTIRARANELRVYLPPVA